MTTGVYAIVNTVNWKTYVGSAAGRGIRHRWEQHRSDIKHGKHHSSYLQRAWGKYGPDAFKFVVIEECAPEDCLMREQFWLDKLAPAYNTCKVAGSCRGVKRAFRKLSDSHREAIRAALKGRTLSDACRLKMSARAKLTNFTVALECVDPVTGIATQYPSIVSAEQAGFYKAGIYRALRGKTKQYRGFFWKRIDFPANMGHKTC
jgi:group I intron endonuclease